MDSLAGQELQAYLHHLGAAAAADAGRFALGNILLTSGEITREQLAAALQRQAKTGRRLGEELVTAGLVSKGQVEKGLRRQRKFIAYALAASAGWAPLAPAAMAAQGNAAIPVSVIVVANARLDSQHQESQLQISAEDVQRGFVEARAASRFSVHTNSHAGYCLEFLPVGNLFGSFQVTDVANHAAHLGPDGGTLVRRGPVPAGLTQSLNFRFALQSDVQPGTYAWPLQMTLRAL
jgi:hypothetical protein